MKRIIKTIAVAFILIFFLSFVFLAVKNFHILRCYFVAFSKLDEVSPKVFVDSEMENWQREHLLSIIEEGKIRIEGVYPAYTAQPVIIAGHTSTVISTFANSQINNQAALANYSPAGVFIIIGPSGFTTDYLAHEMAHAELYTRLGYQSYKKLPSWFDEGLAAQFDERILAYDYNLSDDERILYLESLGKIKGNDTQAYQLSKYEVRTWLSNLPSNGFGTFINQLLSGIDFNIAYKY